MKSRVTWSIRFRLTFFTVNERKNLFDRKLTEIINKNSRIQFKREIYKM